MDPNIIFFFLFIVVFLILTIVNLVGLVAKISNFNLSTGKKAILIIFLIVSLTLGVLFSFSDNFLVAGITLFFASLISGLNWSLNLSRKYSGKKKRRAIVLFTILFTILLPAALIFLIKLFDHLDLIQSE